MEDTVAPQSPTSRTFARGLVVPLAVILTLCLSGSRAWAQEGQEVTKDAPPAEKAAEPKTPQTDETPGETKSEEPPRAIRTIPVTRKVAPGTPPPATSGPAPGVSAPAVTVAPVKRESDPEAIAIVENYLKAIGGRETLGKIRDRVTKFMNVKSGPTGDTEVEINLLMKRMGEFALGIREEWDVKGFDIKGMPLAFTQIYNGVENKGWVVMLETVSSLDGKTLQVFVWDKYIDDFFVNWKDNGYTVTMGAADVVTAEKYGEEHACDVVLVTDFTGRQQSKHYFSKKNGLLLKKEWQEAGSTPRSSVRKEQYHKEYRDLGFLDNSGLSVKFPVRLEIFIDGDRDTIRRFTEVKFNSGLSDAVFAEPEGKPFERVVAERAKPKVEGEEGEPEEGSESTTAAPHARRRPGVVRRVPEEIKPVDVPEKTEEVPESPKEE